MKDLNLGTVPINEKATKYGEPNYRIKSIQECNKYIELLRKNIGPEPKGAKLIIKAVQSSNYVHHEVICNYDEGNKEATKYAEECESRQPKTWKD